MSKVKVRRARPGVYIYPKFIVYRAENGREIARLRATPPAQPAVPRFWQSIYPDRFEFDGRSIRFFHSVGVDT